MSRQRASSARPDSAPRPDEAMASPWPHTNSRVVAFHIDADARVGQPREYRDSSNFKAHLGSREESRSIYILEGLAPDFTALVGDHFRLHPSVFADHHRLVAFSERDTRERGGLPFLPSTIRDRQHISLKYHEALTVCPPPTGYRNLCRTTGRHLMATRVLNTLSDTLIVRRKCSVWSQRRANGGWDCLVITDPPICHVLTDTSGRRGFDVVTWPYNGGYPDFAPHSDRLPASSGPPLTSLLDDLCYYIQNHANRLDLNNPLCVLPLVDKIIASQWTKVFEFVESALEKTQWALSRRPDLADFTLERAEGYFSDIQAWERRVVEFKHDLIGIMLQRGIAPGRLDLFSLDMTDAAKDYQFFHLRLGELSELISRVGSSVSALVNFTGSLSALKAQQLSLQMANQSVRDANNIKALTILGVLFIPFSYTASLFSMADVYAPGGASFWVYFAVSAPLTGLSALCYWIMVNRPFGTREVIATSS